MYSPKIVGHDDQRINKKNSICITVKIWFGGKYIHFSGGGAPNLLFLVAQPPTHIIQNQLILDKNNKNPEFNF